MHGVDVWPFYFSKETGDPATTYHALLPVAGTIKQQMIASFYKILGVTDKFILTNYLDFTSNQAIYNNQNSFLNQIIPAAANLAGRYASGGF